MDLQNQASVDPERGSDGHQATALSPSSIVILLAYGGTLLLANLGSARVLTYHETLFAQPAKEMLRDGSWIVPTIGGKPSNHKPPLTHWSIALAMKALGSDREWVIRLPAVMAALAVALAISLLTARWHGDRVGLLAGLAQLTTFYTLMQARLAESDMLLCAEVSIAMVPMAFATLDGPKIGRFGFRAAWIFHAAAGCAFLTKGPLGPVLIFGAGILFFLLQRDRRALGFLADPIGLVIFAACVLGWPVAALWDHPAILADWKMHHLGRFMGQMGGQRSAWFYAYMIPLLLFPWTPFALLGLWHGLRQGFWKTPLAKLMVAWFLPGFLLLTVSAWKHKHYVIPILPPFSVLAAWGLANYSSRIRRVSSSDRKSLARGLGVTAVIALALVWWRWPTILAPAALVILVGGLASGCILYLETRGRRLGELAVGFGCVWLVAVLVQTYAMPHFDSYRDQTLLARRVNDAVVDSDRVYLFELPENQITYYLRSPLVRVDEESELLERLRSEPNETIHVVAPSSALAKLASLGRVTVIDRCPSIRKIMTEADRITFFEVRRSDAVVAGGPTPAQSR